MAYIGIDPNVGDISFQTFTGDGSTTAFTLAQSVASGEAIIVTIGNVVQEPGASAAYTAYANTLTFSAAPVNGDVITVRYFGRAVDQPLSYGMQLFKYVATASQTVFTGADSSGTVLAFSGTDVDVYLNGVHLDAADFTASSGDTITLAVGAALNDELVIRAFRAFTITDTVSASSGGTFNGAVTFDAGANFGDNDKAIFGAGSDLQIYHNGSASVISDVGTGNFFISGDNDVFISKADLSEVKAKFSTNGAVTLYYDSAAKLATTATGVDVTGSFAVSGNASNASALSDTVTDFALKFDSATTTNYFSNAICFAEGTNVNASIASFDGGSGGAQGLVFGTGTSNTERMRIDSGGNVGIGTASPTSALDVTGTITTSEGITYDGPSTMIIDQAVNAGAMILRTGTNCYMRFDTNGSNERMRLDNDGNLLVGKTDTSTVSEGAVIGAGGLQSFTRSGDTVLRVRRNSNDGTLIQFFKDSSNVGEIKADGGDLLIGTGDTGIRFVDGEDVLAPFNVSTGLGRDNAIDIGKSSERFDDIYATNGTIQTSDANEKQQIAALTDAEITAAKAISALFKTYKWNSAVTEKGGAARTHAGVIAQDVEAAMTAAGLDAGDYAFFISSTWYVDADGNGVEADAEGAIEKNRKGIRYPELLAFVGAATEQRLANIETRLAALEAN